MGRSVGRALPPDPPNAGSRRLLRGGLVVTVGAGVCAALGHLAARGGRRLPPAPAALAEAAVLWPLLALKGLVDAAKRVAAALEHGDLDEARRALLWLVGRPTEPLDAPLLASAAIESLAENLADSVLGPLLLARLLGPGAAAVYRLANTADAVVGHRDRFARGGWASARLDDLLNLGPSRAAALAIALSAPAGPGSAAGAMRCRHLDGRAAASPNAGHPMAAMAGALDVRLEKPGHHILNATGRPPCPADIRAAMRIVRVATVVGLLACAALPRRPSRAWRQGGAA